VWGVGRGVPLPSRLGGPAGERRDLVTAGTGSGPRLPTHFWHILGLKNASDREKNVILTALDNGNMH